MVMSDSEGRGGEKQTMKGELGIGKGRTTGTGGEMKRRKEEDEEG